MAVCPVCVLLNRPLASSSCDSTLPHFALCSERRWRAAEAAEHGVAKGGWEKRQKWEDESENWQKKKTQKQPLCSWKKSFKLKPVNVGRRRKGRGLYL